MIIKTYPAGHLWAEETVADWADPLLCPDWPEYGGHTWMRILWTEEQLSRADLTELSEAGYLLYRSDIPLCKDNGPGFAHSMFFSPAGSLGK